MLTFETIASLQNYLHEQKRQGKSVGFVPTMGALHAGHLSLIVLAQQHTQVVVCSIFVNPMQFNKAEDLATYPKTLAKDLQMLEQAGCQAVFLPQEATIYPEPTMLSFDFGALEQVMEGKYRPKHFNGVAVVVSKLFHIVSPDIAFFGQKDWQQVAIVNQLVKDLGFPLQIKVGETLRETSGLAMSSRNMRLSAEGKQQAICLYEALQLAQKALNSYPIAEVKNLINTFFVDKPFVEVEYFEIVHRDTLQSLDVYLPQKTAICVAAYCQGVRLIDNLLC